MKTRQELFDQLTLSTQMLKSILHARSQTHEAIPHGQRAALLCVASCKSSNVKELARMLGVTSGAATQHIESLVQDELVTRTTDPDDRRNVIVQLSDNGRKLLKRLEQERNALMAELFESIDDNELAGFVAIVTKMSQNIPTKEGDKNV
jgi:DNA-binding MarR family transcriptional regulator